VARSGGATGARSPQRDSERDSQATLAATARRVNTAHIVWGCHNCFQQTCDCHHSRWRVVGDRVCLPWRVMAPATYMGVKYHDPAKRRQDGRNDPAQPVQDEQAKTKPAEGELRDEELEKASGGWGVGRALNPQPLPPG
jgi:hypothetical protein